MTWLTTWPSGHNERPNYAAHESEQQAEAHATELVNSKRASVATVFWIEEER